MKTNLEEIPFVRFFLITSAMHLAFALPAFGVILLLHLLELKAALFLFAMFLLSDPIISWLCWLVAKGSNWVNTAAAMKAAGGVPGQLYGVLAGGLLGGHFLGTVGGLVTMVLSFGLGMLAGIALGSFVAKKLAAGLKEDRDSGRG